MKHRMGLLLVMMVLFISSCGPSNQITNDDYTFSVTSSADRYTMAMSSLPGLPIDGTTKVIKEGLDLEVHYFCTEGQFLSLVDGEIILLGDSIYQAFVDHTIYWVPWTDEMAIPSEDEIAIEVHIDVLDKKSGNLVESSMHVIYQKDFWYGFDQMPEE